MLEIFSGRRVMEVYRVGREVVVVVCGREHRLEDASGAEGCRVVIADGAGDRIGGWGRLGASLQGEVLSRREPGGCIECKVVCASVVALGVSASSGF